MPKPPGKPLTRLTLELPATTTKQIKRLIKATEASSMTEVIRRAVAAYDMIVFVEHWGGEILLKHPTGKTDKLIIL